MYSVADIAQELNLSAKLVRRVIRTHQIETVRDGRHILLTDDAYAQLSKLTRRAPAPMPDDTPGRPLWEARAFAHDKTLRVQHLSLYKRRQERLRIMIKEAGL